MSILSPVYKLLRIGKPEYEYLWRLKHDLADCDSILELGCGQDSPLLKIGAGPRTVGMDIWTPYVAEHLAKGDYRSCIRQDIVSAMYSAPNFDAIVLLDIIEHLRPEEAEAVLMRAQAWAKKKVIVLVPNGRLDNPLSDGNGYQAHQSAWYAWQFPGYRVRGMIGPQWLYGEWAKMRLSPWGFWNYITFLLGPVTYYLPWTARSLYAVKEIE